MAAQTRLWRELPYTQATLGTEETRECRSGAILDGRHLRATLPFVAHCNCIGFLDSARPGYRPHFPLSTKRVFSGEMTEAHSVLYKVGIVGTAPFT